MVKRIYDHFQELGLLACLKEVSHETCEANGKKYVNLDAFYEHLDNSGFFKGGNKNKSCDTLLFNLEENHLVLVEFKRFNLFRSAEAEEKFFNNFKPGISLKMSESLLVLSHYLYSELNISQDDFFNLSKSFLLVYKPKDYKDAIHEKAKQNAKYYIDRERNKYLFKNVQDLQNTVFEEDILSAVV